MHPRAGPWLSPKLVTVNTRPNVFPATRLTLLQIGRPQNEHPATAHRYLRPDEGQARERAHERFLGVADLDHQEPIVGEKPRCRGKMARTESRPSGPEARAMRGSKAYSRGRPRISERPT